MEVHRRADDADLRGEKADQNGSKDSYHPENLAAKGRNSSALAARWVVSSCSLAAMADDETASGIGGMSGWIRGHPLAGEVSTEHR